MIRIKDTTHTSCSHKKRIKDTSCTSCSHTLQETGLFLNFDTFPLVLVTTVSLGYVKLERA